jgi:methylated-DNA-[protein]-cysteine S-methyltransferase
MVKMVTAGGVRRAGSQERQPAGLAIGDTGTDDVAVGALDTPVGTLTVAVSRVGLTGIRWGRTGPPEGAFVVPEPARLAAALEQLSAYFAGELIGFDLPLDLRGMSRARRMVLQTLYDSVPYGSSITYGELAHRSGTGVPARGIGAIMGSNPLPIVVPCHRVLASNGLGGYSGGRSGEGLETKRWLLTMEGVLPAPLDWIQPGRGGSAGG